MLKVSKLLTSFTVAVYTSNDGKTGQTVYSLNLFVKTFLTISVFLDPPCVFAVTPVGMSISLFEEGSN